MIKSTSVQNPKLDIWFSLDSCCSWCIVEECELSENITYLVLLQKGFFTPKDLRAAERAWLNDIKHFSWFSFLDDILICLCEFLIHSINYNLHVFIIKVHKHKCTEQPILNASLNCLTLLNNFWLESCFDMILSENFSTHRGSWFLGHLKIFGYLKRCNLVSLRVWAWVILRSLSISLRVWAALFLLHLLFALRCKIQFLHFISESVKFEPFFLCQWRSSGFFDVLEKLNDLRHWLIWLVQK